MSTFEGVTAMRTLIFWCLVGLAACAFPANAQRVVYIHTDALGSVVLETDANREPVGPRSEYEPYGLMLAGSINNEPGYTGHVQDTATGLVYMQQRYYDPMLGRFLSVDPVTANGNTGTNFNRYWYANNNPYKFTDPDGRLSRGTGFTDKQWKKFDRAQQSAASSLEKSAAKIGAALDTGKGLNGVTRAFEKNFGEGSATSENMAQAAADMGAMAGALRDTSAGAIPANAMTSEQISAAYGGDGSSTLAGVPTTGPTQVIVNVSHSDFNNPSTLAWGAGHETSHAVLGYKDQFYNGAKAYKFGSPLQRDAFDTLPSGQRLINPDHLMDQAR